jgi:hypothetical protein
MHHCQFRLKWDMDVINLKIKTIIPSLFIAILAVALLIVSNGFANVNAQGINTNGPNNNNNGGGIPSAQSVYETGTMALPSTVSGAIISIPDEGHHPLVDQKTISLKNPSYVPSNLVVPSGASIAYVHGDPGHVHVGTVTDSSSGTVAWQTTPVEHPGGSDAKVLPAGKYDVKDEKYPDMKGTITVSNNVKSAGNLVVGGLFVPTPSLEKYKSDFAKAGFNVLSSYDFVDKTVQKDINGPNSLIMYSTSAPIGQAIPKLFPILESLPYK